MKTKPLDEVMKAATPGPVEVLNAYSEIWIGIRTPNSTLHVATVPRAPDGDWSPANAALLAHWFNHGPKLVEALDSVDAEWRSDPTSTQCFDSRLIAKAREALAQAKQVQIP